MPIRFGPGTDHRLTNAGYSPGESRCILYGYSLFGIAKGKLRVDKISVKMANIYKSGDIPAEAKKVLNFYQ